MQRCQVTLGGTAVSGTAVPRPTRALSAAVPCGGVAFRRLSSSQRSLAAFNTRQERRAVRGLAPVCGLEGLPPRAAAPPPPPPAQQGSSPRRLLHQLARLGGATALAAAMSLSFAGAAEAARSGGRMGGSSFGRSSFSSSSFGGGGGFGTGGFGASSAFRGSMGSSSSRLGSNFRSSYSPSPLGGGFGGSLAPSAGGVRVNSFFLSPFGGGSDYTYEGGYTEGYDEVVTVGKVQVGLLGSARELQRDLERIADKADTDSPEGLHYILQETVLALMRNPDYCLYGFAKSKRERCAEDAETAFNQLSLQERSKFQKETRSNVGGFSRKASLAEKKPYAQGDKELIVVTVLVAADGGFKLPQITSRTEMREALSILGACRPDDLLAVEVLWTPEEEDDFFTVEDLAYDYPTLNTL